MVLLKSLFFVLVLLEDLSYNPNHLLFSCSLVQMQSIAKTCLFAEYAVYQPAMIVNIFRTAANVMKAFAKSAVFVFNALNATKCTVWNAKIWDIVINAVNFSAKNVKI